MAGDRLALPGGRALTGGREKYFEFRTKILHLNARCLRP
jgi:hypothetical protein